MLVRYLMAGALAALAACGSSESGPDAQVPDLTSRIGATMFNDILEGNELDDEDIATLDTAIGPIATTLFENQPVTPWSNVPTSGSVGYAGGIEIVPVGDESRRIFGALTVTANFDPSPSITGTASDFHTDEGLPNGGTLTLNGTIDRGNDLTNNFGIAGDISGELAGDALSGTAEIPIGADFADSATVIYGGGGSADPDALPEEIGVIGDDRVTSVFVVFQN